MKESKGMMILTDVFEILLGLTGLLAVLAFLLLVLVGLQAVLY